MAQLQLSDIEYPCFQRGKPTIKLISAKVKLIDRPRLPVMELSAKGKLSGGMADRPLQRSLRWEFEGAHEPDVAAFIRGRYWHRIETALYAIYLNERGLTNHAQAYMELSGL